MDKIFENLDATKQYKNNIWKAFILACVLLIIIIFWQIKVNNGQKVHSLQDTTFTIELSNEKPGESFLVKSFFSKKENLFYLCLPSYLSDNMNEISHNYIDDLYILNDEGQIDIKTIEFDKGLYTVCDKQGESILLKIISSENTSSVFINTKSKSMDYVHGASTTKDKNNKEDGRIKIVDGQGKIQCDQRLDSIKGHGNSTWLNNEKKSYNIDIGEIINLFGVESEKFVLLSNSYDKSLFRNLYVYDLSRSIGLSAPKSTIVDLWLNGEYNGTYLMCQKINITPDFVNIYDLEYDNELLNGPMNDFQQMDNGESTMGGNKMWVNAINSPKEVTGGYILEFIMKDYYEKIDLEKSEPIGQFVSLRGQLVRVISPQYPTKEEIEYISDFFQEMEDALYSETGYNGKNKHFTEYLDLDSFVKMYLIQEFTMNADAVSNSFYCFKNRADIDDKLYSGPVWDFDISLGNTSNFWVDLTNPEVLFIQNLKIRDFDESNNYPNILARLISHEQVSSRILEIWNNVFYPTVLNSYADEICDSPNLKHYISQYYDSAIMNFSKWDVLNDTLYKEVINTDWNENVNYLEKFIIDRGEYLNEIFNSTVQE